MRRAIASLPDLRRFELCVIDFSAFELLSSFTSRIQSLVLSTTPNLRPRQTAFQISPLPPCLTQSVEELSMDASEWVARLGDSVWSAVHTLTLTQTTLSDSAMARLSDTFPHARTVTFTGRGGGALLSSPLGFFKPGLPASHSRF